MRSQTPAIVFVLWGGHLGGAERHTIEVIRVLRSTHGVDAGIVFVGDAGRSSSELDALSIPYRSLGLKRGSSAVFAPRALASNMTQIGQDVAFLGYGGYLARAARFGGYRGALISVEHGGILQNPISTLSRRLKERVSRLVGEHTLDATVCVSDFVREEVLRHRHVDDVRVIYNGVDTERFHPSAQPPSGVVFGHAGRLIEGKGILQLVRAFEPGMGGGSARLLIAGDGPARAEAQRIVEERGIGDSVEFLGVIDDMPGFWQRCSVGLQPTTRGWRESFCLAVVEAMSTGLPVIVSTEGALPEIVGGADVGRIIEPGDVSALRTAMTQYAQDSELRSRQGAAARDRAVATFDINRAALQYLEVATELSERTDRERTER